MDRVLIAFATFLAAIVLAASVSAGGDSDRDSNCWHVVGAKSRIVFANTCNPEASFAVKVKDLAQ